MAQLIKQPSAANPRLNEIIVPAGVTLFSAGDQADAVFIVTEGEIGIYSGDSGAMVASLVKGSSFGEQAVIGTKQRLASARAIRDSRVLEIPATKLSSEIDQSSPKLRTAFDALTLQLLQKNYLTEFISQGCSGAAKFDLGPGSLGSITADRLINNRDLNSVYISDTSNLIQLIESGKGVVITGGRGAMLKDGIVCEIGIGGVLGVAESIAMCKSVTSVSVLTPLNGVVIDGDTAYQAFLQLSAGLKGVVKGLIVRALDDNTNSDRF